ncbi:MAG TPA: hypothetical protein VJV74_04090 [Terriglobia bacterium]|nr:hypothetical protein [Terriglobia bacterium]
MWEHLPPKIRLRGTPRVAEPAARQLRADFERFRAGLPKPLEPYILSTYGIDLASEYGGRRIQNPFGKASGQLSLAAHQVERDAQAGLGFVVLKTVIAQNVLGEQTMAAWAIPETRMLVERIQGRSSGCGWTVTWKGRGWFDSFDAYLKLFDAALAIGRQSGLVVAPSVKYHLPTPAEDCWKEDEYVFTTQALAEIWRRYHKESVMPLEKDFSPTLAGSERATQQAKILEWLLMVPRLIHRAVPGQVCVGLKIFNAMFEDDFQLRMLGAVEETRGGEDRADFMVYANRLFDPAKTFEEKRGVAYGGPDLSDRNLAILERFLGATQRTGARTGPGMLPLSATGDIHSGRTAVEYLLRGASSFQMHTIFQLPDSEFTMQVGNRTEKAMHYLIFHPQDGFLAWLLDLRARCGWDAAWNVAALADWSRQHWKIVASELSQ